MSERRKCRSFLITAPSRKKRVVIDGKTTMQALLKDLSSRFGGVEIREIRDESGCAIDRVDDIFEDDTLVVVPADYEDPASGSDSSGAGGGVDHGGSGESDSGSGGGDESKRSNGRGKGGGSSSSRRRRGAPRKGSGRRRGREKERSRRGGGADGEQSSSGSPGAHEERKYNAGSSKRGARGYGGGTMADPSSVVELQVLSTASAADFVIDVVVGGGQNGIVFATKCTRPGLPRPQKTYATKLVFNFGITTKTGTANTFENEYYVLSVLPPHPNVMRFWGTFWDKIPEAALRHLPKFAREQANYRDHTGVSQRRKAQFVVLDYHPQSLQSHLRDLPVPLAYRTVLEFTVDLLRGVAHLDTHRVAHLDLKSDNVLVAHDGRLVICDFGTAIQFRNRDMEMPYRQGLAPGGNQLHLAPEVLNSFNAAIRGGRGGNISYARQEVWAVGVMVYEMAVRTPPFPDYPNDCRSGPQHSITYDDAKLPPLPPSYPAEFTSLVRSMLLFDPEARVSANTALETAEELLAALPPDEVVATSPKASGKGDGAITITVKSVDGSATVITAQRSTRIAEIKARVASRLMGAAVAPGDLFVLFAGNRCQDDMTLDEVGVEGESCVHLVRKPVRASGGRDSAAADGGSPTTGGAGGAGAGGDAGAGHHRSVGSMGSGTVGAEGDGDEAGSGPVFNTSTMHPDLTCVNGQRTIIGRTITWGTAVVAQEPVRYGRHCWRFRVDALVPPNRGGMAIGVVAAPFDTASGILGAHLHSWGYSGRTGDKGDGSGFVKYGERYGNGDIIGVDLDLDAGTLSFSKNGKPQGVAFDTGLRGKEFLAGVCIGGVQKEGGAHEATVLSMVQKGSHSFSTTQRHPAIQLSAGNRTADSHERAWGTCLIAEPPVRRGVHRWEFLIDNLDSENKGGMAIGVVTSTFPVDSGILGANRNSWAYSGRTGDVGDGGGRFVTYGEPYGTGDRVAVILDMDAGGPGGGGELRFTKNGRDQGVAYSGVFTDEVIGVGILAAVCIGGVQRKGG